MEYLFAQHFSIAQILFSSYPELQAENLRKLYTKDTRFHCNELCMNKRRICRKKCQLKRKSRLVARAYCDGGVLPSRCQKCCPYKDTGCYCNKSCMESIGSPCNRCPVMNDIGRTYCTDLGIGWENILERAFVPRECASCCRGCKNIADNM